MKAVLAYLKRLIEDEPALVVSTILIIVNSIWKLSAEDADTLRIVIENLIILAGGGAIRQQVTPVAKLKRGSDEA